MTDKLYDPAIEVNNKSVLTNPNTIVADPGFGETKVDIVSRGNGNTEVLTSTDISTHKGKVKFELPLTIETRKQVSGWQRNRGKNTVELVATADGKTYSEYYQKMSVTNTADSTYGVDAKIMVEMEGSASE